MSTAHLEDRSLIAVSGPEARAFLQGLITNDVELVSSEHPIYAALLTPQGKILFDFLIFELDGTLLIDCAREMRASLIKRLSLYRLRSKVSIDNFDRRIVLASWDSREDQHQVWFADPRLAALGLRALAVGEPRTGLLDAAAYRARRLALGVPEAADFGSDRMFVLDADFEELHGVSFDKGCYIGQELTARMKHRGTARKRLLPIETVGGVLPPPGTGLTADGRNIGDIASAYGTRGFALVRLDRLPESGVEAAGTRVAIHRPAWLFS